MKKLIELLNEYEKELNTGLHWRIDEKYWMLWRWLNLMWVDQYLISKHYWFIKRLVDNDKIDRLTFCTVETPSSKYEDFDLWPETPREDYTNILLMDLAIQDKPIEFLISILR